MFINLLNHSSYSLLMSSMSIDDIINFAIKNKQEYVCLTDYNNLYGAIEFYNKAIANKLKPIIGLHININDQDVYLIAKNNNGYKNIIKVSSIILGNEQLDLSKYTQDVYVIANNTTTLNLTNATIYNFNDLAINPIYFENKEDIVYFKSLQAIASGKLLEELNDKHDYDQCYCLTEADAKQKYNEQQLSNLEKLVKSCSWTIEFYQERHMIKYPTNKNTKLLLQTLCVDGLKTKLKNQPVDINKYINRLKYELDVVDKMGFNDYFLVVRDYVCEAKNKGILVGPGRGSAAGSLISYSLDITQVDPIKYDLIFERFLNPERSTMPDIDVDFMDDRRGEVIQYLFDKYGKEHVAHIIIFQRIKAKMAIRDVGRILNIDKAIIDKISKLLNEEGFEQESKTIKKQLDMYESEYPQLFSIAKKIVGFPRQVGIHAAGVVLSDKLLSDIVPTQIGSDGFYLTQFSMEYLEPLGLIKMDILGLINLSTINDAIQLIYKRHSVDLKLSDIKMNDQKVFDYIAAGNTCGVFQLESSGMTSLVKRIKPKSIEDISICSALYRPGPQKNIPIYLSNKANPQSIHYLNDKVKHILEPTYNIIIYQEQVIQMVQQVANFSLADADLFRRAISKKNVEKLAVLKDRFITGGINNGYDQKEVEKIYDYIFEFANYGFNHSHSLAYSYISYWLAYIAYYYSLEFYTTLLKSNDWSSEKISEYISNARQLGISILPVDINESEYSFSINNKSIILGFNIIKGVGSALSKKIIEYRESLPNKKITNLLLSIKELKNNGIGLKSLQLLITAGAFDNVLKAENKSRFWLINNIENIFNNCENIGKDGKQITRMDLIESRPTIEEQMNMQYEEFKLTGISFVEHPLIKIKKELNLEEFDIKQLKDLDTSTAGYYHVFVLLNDVRVITDKNKKQMAFISFEDETKSGKAVVFAGAYDKLKDFLVKKNVVILTIKADANRPNNFVVSNARLI